jgi:hypothetical protein
VVISLGLTHLMDIGAPGSTNGKGVQMVGMSE